jgi:hypothetical protein
MFKLKVFAFAAAISVALPAASYALCPYDSNCLNNPYGAGSPYKADGPYSPSVAPTATNHAFLSVPGGTCHFHHADDGMVQARCERLASA